MNKSLSILIGFGIIALGVWVYKTRTPVALPTDGLTAIATPDVGASPSAAPAGDSAAPSPAAAEVAAPASELDQILSTLKGPDQRKLVILDEILKSKNDNDLRLDTEFKQLSPELKRAMAQYYKAIPDEQRNERGTIAFLYARAMTAPEDMNFITQVLLEKPCLSLADCSKAGGSDREHAHLEGLAETTANYPQLTAIRQALQRYNAARGETPPNEALARAILDGYRKASQESQNPRIQEEARQVLRYLGKP